MEKFKEGRTGKGTVTPNPKFNFSSPNFHGGDVNLEKISELNTSHEAREYLEKRGIKDLEYFTIVLSLKLGLMSRKKPFDNCPTR